MFTSCISAVEGVHIFHVFKGVEVVHVSQTIIHTHTLFTLNLSNVDQGYA